MDERLGGAAWAAGLLVVAGVATGVVTGLHLAAADATQQLPLVSGLAGGHLNGVLGDTGQTSGPGAAVVMVPAYLVAHLFVTKEAAYHAASAACLLPVAVAAVAALRASGVVARSIRELVGTALVVLGVPVLACLLEALHPADLVATAAVLGAAALVVRRRVGWAAALLGFALVTRQWAMVAVVVVVVLERGRARWIVGLGSFLVAAILVAPFALVDPHHTKAALLAKDTIRTSRSLPGLIPVGGVGLYLMSRYLPVMLVVLLCLWLHGRGARASPEVLVASLAVAFSIRSAVDPAGFGYYAAPGYATFVILVARRWRWCLGAVLGGMVLWLRLYVHRWPTIIERIQANSSFSTTVIERGGVAWAAVGTATYVALLVASVVALERASRPLVGSAEGPVLVPSAPVDAGGSGPADG